MSQKYVSASDSTLITNDLYLAAFLQCVGCRLDRLSHNGRRRVSFVFVGELVRELREAYRSGPVRLDMRAFRDSLTRIRRLMDGVNDQRSAPCPQPRLEIEECRTQLSPA